MDSIRLWYGSYSKRINLTFGIANKSDESIYIRVTKSGSCGAVFVFRLQLGAVEWHWCAGIFYIYCVHAFYHPELLSEIGFSRLYIFPTFHFVFGKWSAIVFIKFTSLAIVFACWLLYFYRIPQKLKRNRLGPWKRNQQIPNFASNIPIRLINSSHFIQSIEYTLQNTFVYKQWK